MEGAELKTIPKTLFEKANKHWEQYLNETKNLKLELELANPLADEQKKDLLRVFSISEYCFIKCKQNPKWPIDFFQQSYPALSPVNLLNELASKLTVDLDYTTAQKTLRSYRHRLMCLILMRFILKKSDLVTHLYELSLVADIIIQTTTQYIFNKMKKEIGEPISLSEEEISFNVIALGKLGGEELNFSSDIDLMFSFSNLGKVEPVGRPISIEQFFSRLGQNLIKLLSEITDDGFVYRVDMRLRPYGDSGALVMHFDQLEQYYQYQGRDWERYALVKARIVYGDRLSQQKLNNIIQPFVYRKYLDYGAFEALREMKTKIQLDVIKHNRQNDIKLGEGGIRQIEFFVQAFQLIRGGKQPILQNRHLLSALSGLYQTNVISQKTYTELKEAYIFLRTLEHMIQIIRDEQTHRLPSEEIDCQRVAYAMGVDDWTSLMTNLDLHRQTVSIHFNSLSEIPSAQQPKFLEKLNDINALWLNVSSAHENRLNVSSKFISDLNQFKHGQAVRKLKAKGRQRLDQVMPIILDKIIYSENPEILLERSLKFISAILRRSAYLTFLLEKEGALIYLMKLLEQSEWITLLLVQYPVLLDDLLTLPSIEEIQSKSYWENDLSEKLKGLEDDLEQQMEKLRQFKLSGYLNIALIELFANSKLDVSRSLNFLVEVILESVFKICTRFIIHHFKLDLNDNDSIKSLPFIIVAYGKLGAKELSYLSDLDLVFLYSDQAFENNAVSFNPEVYIRLAQRMIHVLSIPTLTGKLFDVDVRLRPGGSAGMLVSSIFGFKKYLQEQAWTFEHQALVNARFLVGHQVLGEHFAHIREEVLCQEREQPALKQEIANMRNKMLANRKDSSEMIKLVPGGMVDVEFIAQFGVLQLSHSHPQITQCYGTINILKSLTKYKFLPDAVIQNLISIYNDYQKQQRLILHSKKNLDHDQLKAHQTQVLEIWKNLFD